MAAPVDGLQVPLPSFASSLPIADRASLVGLNDNDLRAWCAAKADEYSRFTLAVAPIHRLPPEILSKIFEGCWTDRKSLRVGHVCRRWRSVLLSTTRFWVDAVDGEKFSPDEHSITYLGVTLERSAPRMVEPSFSRFSESISHCLSFHVGRFVSLEVSLADESELSVLWGSLNSGMHHLRTLTIAFDKDGDPDHVSWTDNPRIESLSPPVLPRLTRVTAPPFLFPILAVPSLRHITLKVWHEHHVYDGQLGSLECFCEALAVCSQNLRLLGLFRASFWVDIVVSPCLVSLPALRHLQITDTTRSCVLVLSCLSLPKTTRIHCTNVDNGSLCTIISANPDPFHSSITATDRVEIRGTADTVSVHCCAGDEERLGLCLAGAHRHLRPDDVIQLFRDKARIRQLTVSGLDRRDVQGVEFRAFPHLVHTALCGETAARVLAHLARREDDSGLVSPRLETLAVDFQSESWRRGGPDGLGAALRNGDVAVVETDLRGRCAELARVLSFRLQKGGERRT